MSNLSIGATYWPRRKGTLLWAEFDRGEVRDELQQVAAVGIDTVRLPLHWEEFQPRPERVAAGALRLLEHVLNLAADARLRVVPQLMPLAIGGAIHLPAWATAASFAADMTLSTKFGPLVIVRNEQRPPLVWERSEHKTEVRDLWTNPVMREAQRKLIGEVVGYFGDHPVISGWELGSGIELGRAPSSADAAADWLGETADVARQHGARGDMYYAATLRSLFRREGPRPDAIASAKATLALNLVPPEPALKNQALTVDMLRFVTTLVRSLGGAAPVLILGAPTVVGGRDTIIADRAYGRQIEQPLLDYDGYGRLVETALPALQAEAVPAVWFAHTFCYGQPFPPERAHSQRERMMGLFDTNGEELPAANAVQRYRDQPASEEQNTFTPLDVENYWADPSAHFRRLWRQWQATDE